MPQTQIKCPQCQQPFVADIHQLFDAGENPQAKQLFLSGMFNIAECPHCGYQGRLSTPLVYHDPEKELLLTHYPQEMGLSVEDQQKAIGPLINQIVNNLPQEKRKGYLFNPKTMLTMQGMLETVLEADGITKDMIKAQEERLNLIQRLLTSPEEARLDIIRDEDEIIDRDIFGILSRLMESATIQQDEAGAERLNDLQELLLEHSSQGKKLQSEAMEIQDVMETLRDLGDQVSREKILDLVINADTDSKIRAYAQLARPAMDYQFFQMLSDRIERARKKGKERLKTLREKLLQATKEVDDEFAARSEIAQKNVEAILQVEDMRTVLEQNMSAVDEFFIQAVSQSLEKARKEGDLEHSARIQQLLDIINELSAPPPEFEFIESLLEVADDQGALETAIIEKKEEITPDLIQIVGSLVTQNMASVEQSTREEKEEQAAVLERLEAVHKALLRFSMRQSFRSKN